jgi:MtN3 and saliva related transmembrane protein
MGVADIMGGLAATLTTISFFPQAVQVLRTRDTRAISLAMYTLFTMGIACWGIYGVLTMQWPIIIANGLTLLIAFMILAMKARDVMAARRPATRRQGIANRE